MKVSIWDMDWYYKQSFIPNIKCMQLSSYHKQKGDEINFITDKTQLGFIYDIMYIVKEKLSTPMPDRSYIDNNKNILIGGGFKYFKTKALTPTMVACRPDYLLYQHIGTKYDNANFITFYANGKLVKNRQDYHNAKNNKKFTIVSDTYFWKATDEEIIFCLEQLKDDKNLAFLEPISLRRIISNSVVREKFLALHFTIGTPFKWRNDYADSIDNNEAVIQFLLELRSYTKSDLGFIPIKGILSNESLEAATYRCFKITELYKTNKLKCVIFNEKGYRELDTLEMWTHYAIQFSYIEFVLHDYCASSGVLWYDILNNSIHWRNVKIDRLLYYLTADVWEDMKKSLLLQWGDTQINSHNIDFKYIKENIGVFFKE